MALFLSLFPCLGFSIMRFTYPRHPTWKYLKHIPKADRKSSPPGAHGMNRALNMLMGCMACSAIIFCGPSPVIDQVLGHLKTSLVLAFGYILLLNPFSWRNIFGIAVAVVGMTLYSCACVLESQQKSVDTSPTEQSIEDSESDPLLSVENGVAAKQIDDSEDLPPNPWNETRAKKGLQV